VVLHIGGYHGGNIYKDLNFAPQDLAAAGFYVVVAGYPLAPPDNIKGQYDLQVSDPDHSGRYPQQTRAIEAFIDAAKNDPNCYNQRVGVLGGSAGASHAAYVALDTVTTYPNWPYWIPTTRPLCVACLSGQYDFSDRDADVSATDHFIPDIENYTYTDVPQQQWLDSPIGLVAGAASNPPFVPMYCIRAEWDPGSPKSNSDYFWYTMHQAGANAPTFFMETVPDSTDHAFSTWDENLDDGTGGTSYTVSERVIAFFRQYLYN
jgi:acetyl esterase/lipase